VRTRIPGKRYGRDREGEAAASSCTDPLMTHGMPFDMLVTSAAGTTRRSSVLTRARRPHRTFALALCESGVRANASTTRRRPPSGEDGERDSRSARSTGRRRFPRQDHARRPGKRIRSPRQGYRPRPAYRPQRVDQARASPERLHPEVKQQLARLAEAHGALT